MYEKITVPRNTTAVNSNNINDNKDNKNTNKHTSEVMEEQ